MKTKSLPALPFLRECFIYDGEKLIWKNRPRSHFSTNRGWNGSNTRCGGKPAGTLNGRYRSIWIGQTAFLEHRLIWFLVTENDPGEWEIDHRDGNKLNNSFANLRKADRCAQNHNRSISRNSTSGLKGVSWHPRLKKWHARVGFKNRRISLGYFNSKEAAFSACEKKRAELHGDFACDGFRPEAQS